LDKVKNDKQKLLAANDALIEEQLTEIHQNKQ
jgi:hypothetical protein